MFGTWIQEYLLAQVEVCKKIENFNGSANTLKDLVLFAPANGLNASSEG